MNTKIETAINVTKFTISGIVGIGTTKIVRSIIKNNIDEPETTKDQVTVEAGSIVLGMVAAAKTKEFTDTFIDDFVNNIKTMPRFQDPQITEDN